LREFTALYWKELKGEKDAIFERAMLMLVIVLVFIIVGKGVIPGPGFSSELLLGILEAVLFLLLPVWIIPAGYSFLGREWKEGSVALWAALPVERWKLLLAKMCALCTEFVLLGGLLLAGLSFWFFPWPFQVLLNVITMLTMLLLLILIYLPLAPAVFGVFLSGVSVSRLAAPVRILAGAILLGAATGVGIIFSLLVGETAALSPGLAGYLLLIPVGDFLPLPVVAGFYAAGILGFALSLYFLGKRPVA